MRVRILYTGVHILSKSPSSNCMVDLKLLLQSELGLMPLTDILVLLVTHTIRNDKRLAQDF